MADRYADRYQGRPTRAEDGRAPGQAPQAGESDPLAELARLIGQTDPFANLGRGGREPPPAPSYDDRYEAPGHDAPDENTSGHDTSYQDTSDQDHSDHDAPPEFDVKPSRPSWMQRVAQREAPQELRRNRCKLQKPTTSRLSPNRRSAMRIPQHRIPRCRKIRIMRRSALCAVAARAPRICSRMTMRTISSSPIRRVMTTRSMAWPTGRIRIHDPHAVYPEDAYVQQGYDEEAAERVRPKRGGMMTVVVVAALAVVGTAGAYTYRTWHGSPRNGEAPIIKADPGPNKVVPPTQSADGSSKPIQDRVATAPGSERIVSREEQPGRSEHGQDRPARGVSTADPESQPEPGRRHGSGHSGVPSGAWRDRNLAGRRRAAQGRTPGHPARSRPMPGRPLPPPSRDSRSPRPLHAPAPATTATTSPPANAPMSLSPGAAPTRTASNNPAAAASAAASTGGYVVQISSQRSEADAQASHRAPAGQVPQRARPPRAADQAGRSRRKGNLLPRHGRAVRHPRRSVRPCGSLKTAGGQCVVQRN